MTEEQENSSYPYSVWHSIFFPSLIHPIPSFVTRHDSTYDKNAGKGGGGIKYEYQLGNGELYTV
jgi:hypothetical protein